MLIRGKESGKDKRNQQQTITIRIPKTLHQALLDKCERKPGSRGRARVGKTSMNQMVTNLLQRHVSDDHQDYDQSLRDRFKDVMPEVSGLSWEEIWEQVSRDRIALASYRKKALEENA